MLGQEAEITVGEAPTITELVIYFLIGYVLFFKLVGMIVAQPDLSNGVFSIKDYFLSLGHGSRIGGVIGAVALSYYYYY